MEAREKNRRCSKVKKKFCRQVISWTKQELEEMNKLEREEMNLSTDSSSPQKKLSQI